MSLDYVSNLVAPDLRAHFQYLTWRTEPFSFDHLFASDWADKADEDEFFKLYKRCGLWTRDEAAILYECAFRSRDPEGKTEGAWLDIGAHTGWTTAHISAAGCRCLAIEPMLQLNEFSDRFTKNLQYGLWEDVTIHAMRSAQFFEAANFPLVKVSGACIDGDHEPGMPIEDAKNVASYALPDCVILFHDFVGQPVREAVTWLLDQGWHARIYWTPFVVACCWRGDFAPPPHRAEASLFRRALWGRMPDFDFGRCE